MVSATQNPRRKNVASVNSKISTHNAALKILQRPILALKTTLIQEIPLPNNQISGGGVKSHRGLLSQSIHSQGLTLQNRMGFSFVILEKLMKHILKIHEFIGLTLRANQILLKGCKKKNSVLSIDSFSSKKRFIYPMRNTAANLTSFVEISALLISVLKRTFERSIRNFLNVRTFGNFRTFEKATFPNVRKMSGNDSYRTFGRKKRKKTFPNIFRNFTKMSIFFLKCINYERTAIIVS